MGEVELKTCLKCGGTKPRASFHLDKRSKDGLRNHCRSCRSKVIRTNYHHNLEKNTERAAAYYDRNKDKILSKRKANPRKVNTANRTEYTRNKRNSDVGFRIGGILRSRLQKALRGLTKASSATRDLGCTIEEFKSYLGSKFYASSTGGEMTWNNYGYGPGKWQIDHIKELSSFDLSQPDQQKAACHYLNTQPLWHEDHVRKTANYLNSRQTAA